MTCKKALFFSFLEWVLFSLLIFLAIHLSLTPRYSLVLLDGIKLWAFNILPSLLPYFFITALLEELKVTKKFASLLSPLTTKLFKVNGACGYAFIISLISGYPVGSKMVCDLKNKGLINEIESVRASALCSNSSPAFLISVVGGALFNSTTLGLKLFLSHILASLGMGFIFSFYKRKNPPKPLNSSIPTSKKENLLYDTAYSSIISLLVVGTIISVFYLFTEILFSLGILTPFTSLLEALNLSPVFARGIVSGLFECTQGIKILATSQNNFSLPLVSLLCGFGGLSVICQSLVYLKKAKIKTAPFIFAKIGQAVLSFFIAFLINLF